MDLPLKVKQALFSSLNKHYDSVQCTDKSAILYKSRLCGHKLVVVGDVPVCVNLSVLSKSVRLLHKSVWT